MQIRSDVIDDSDLGNPTQTLTFDVKDEASEVLKYLVQLDGAEPYVYLDETGSSTMELRDLAPGYHSLIIEAFDQANNSIVGTFSFTIEAFQAPTFIEYPSEINEEVIPVIKGKTRPDARVFVTLEQVNFTETANAAETEHEVRSDSEGVFTFIPDSRLTLGVYELSAYAVDKHGAQSERSEWIRIAVQQPGYITFGTLVVNVLSLAITLIALLVLLGILMLFVWRRLKRLRRRVHVEATEALAVFDKEHKKVLKALTEQSALLKKSRRGNKLTKAETELIDDVTERLKDMQRSVRKEISDVDEMVE